VTPFKVNTTLNDGTPVLIRSLGPQDKEDILTGFERLSPHSRYLRYSSGGVKLTPVDLDAMTCGDETKCLSIGAADLNRSEHYGIGLARYMICEDEPGFAEIAMVVIDEYQRRGLGSLMLDIMITIAKKNGIQAFCGYLLPENRVMIHLLRRVNAELRYTDDGMIRMEMSLSNPLVSKRVNGFQV